MFNNSISQNEKTCRITGPKFIPIDGGYYRADYTFIVTKDNIDETITQTKYKTA